MDNNLIKKNPEGLPKSERDETQLGEEIEGSGETVYPQPQVPAEPEEKVETPPHVVDKRTYHEELDEVPPTADELTREADNEEDEFIERVMKEHLT